jgi:hypothetical protein
MFATIIIIYAFSFAFDFSVISNEPHIFFVYIDWEEIGNSIQNGNEHGLWSTKGKKKQFLFSLFFIEEKTVKLDDRENTTHL